MTQSELNILFPEVSVKLPATDQTVSVKPLNFKQTGQALALIAPLAAVLDLQMAGDKVQFSNLNFPALIFSFVQDDCAIALRLIELATPLSAEEIETLPAQDGVTLLREVFKTAIAPLLDLFVKKPESDPLNTVGETSSSPLPELDLAAQKSKK